MTDDFRERNDALTARMVADPHVREATREWMAAVLPYEYHYYFTWMGVPIIQFPSDIVTVQELLWEIRPDLIVETGIARGGSLVSYASMLELMGEGGKVVGVDRDIRSRTERTIASHPLRHRIRMMQGSSTDIDTVERIPAVARSVRRVIVALDSNHTHDYVLRELRLYGPLVTRGSYLVVFDTVIEELPDRFHEGKPWRQGDSAGSAVREFMQTRTDFVVDHRFDNKALVTVAPGGFRRKT